MKPYQRIIALFTALLLSAGLFGCLVRDTKTEPTEPTAGASSAPVDTSSFDRDAVAIELGTVQITAGEVSDSYDYYMSMLESYYGSTPTDDASIAEYRELAVSDLIKYHVPEWKAAEAGVTLSDEQNKAIEDALKEEIEEMRVSLICYYAYAYGGADEVDTVEELTEEQLDAAMTQIALELETYFGEGYTLDQYLKEQSDAMLEDKRLEALKDVLKEAFVGDVQLSDEQIDAWYEATLEAQKAEFDETPLYYREQFNDYLSGDTTVPPLYLPEGFVKVQLVRIAPESQRDLKIETNRAAMAELEKEYGRLALTGEDEARQEEIKAAYRAMAEENEALEEAFLGAARKAIKEAYAALQKNTPFEDVMKQYNGNGPEEVMLYTAGEDALYGELCDVAEKLAVGAYSEPMLIDDVYYIVKRLETPASGVQDRAALAEEIRAAATADEQETEWNALYTEWENEAESAAVLHEETYAAVGYLN